MTKKEKILIVECEESMQKFLRDILIKEGYEIAMASNGLDAKEKLQKEKIDLALVDLRMRPESGKELIEYIHNEVDPDIVNIIITGYPEDWSPTNATDQHVYHYFKKEELDSRDLIKVVKNGLEFRKLKFIEKEASAAAMAETAELYNDLLSKDITNYNQSIMSYLGLLKKTNLDEKQKKYVDIALTQVKNSVELISDIQKLSKIGTKDLSNALKTLKIDREHIFLKQIDSLMDKYIQFGDISLIKSGIKNSLNRLCDTSDVQAVCLIDMSGTVLSSCQGPMMDANTFRYIERGRAHLRSIGYEIGVGLKNSLLRYEDGILALSGVGGSAILMALLRPESDLTINLKKIDIASKVLQHIMEQKPITKAELQGYGIEVVQELEGIADSLQKQIIERTGARTEDMRIYNRLEKKLIEYCGENLPKVILQTVLAEKSLSFGNIGRKNWKEVVKNLTNNYLYSLLDPAKAEKCSKELIEITEKKDIEFI